MRGALLLFLTTVLLTANSIAISIGYKDIPVNPLHSEGFPCEVRLGDSTQIRLALMSHDSPQCAEDALEEMGLGRKGLASVLIEGVDASTATGSKFLVGGENPFFYELHLLLANVQIPRFWNVEKMEFDHEGFNLWRPYLISFMALVATSNNIPAEFRQPGPEEKNKLPHQFLSKLSGNDFWQRYRDSVWTLNETPTDLSEEAWQELKLAYTSTYLQNRLPQLFELWHVWSKRLLIFYLKQWEDPAFQKLQGIEPPEAKTAQRWSHALSISLNSGEEMDEISLNKLFHFVARERSRYLEWHLAKLYCDSRHLQIPTIARLGLAHIPDVWQLFFTRLEKAKLTDRFKLELDARALAYPEVRENALSVRTSEAAQVFTSVEKWIKDLPNEKSAISIIR